MLVIIQPGKYNALRITNTAAFPSTSRHVTKPMWRCLQLNCKIRYVKYRSSDGEDIFIT